MSSQNDTSTHTTSFSITGIYTSPTPTSTLSNSNSNITSTANATNTTYTSFSSSVITATSTATTTTTNGGIFPTDYFNPPGTVVQQANNQSGISTQLLICGVSGILLFLVFCFLRTRYLFYFILF